MPRPRKCRIVSGEPIASTYKPCGIPLRNIEVVTLSTEGFEALRLADALNMEHEEAAKQMNVSRPTFSRILSKARYIVAHALTNGYGIEISGGNYALAEDYKNKCCKHKRHKNCCENSKEEN